MKNIQFTKCIFNFLPLLLCIWIPLSYCHTDTPSEVPVSSLHRHVIVNKTDGWKEIDLVYEKTFSHNLSNDNKTIAGCVKAYNTAGKTLFRCKEHIMLLRPGKVIKHWLEEQQQAGYINLTIKEFGLINTRVYISAIKPASISQKCYLQLFAKSNETNYSTESSCVTGVFKRHVDEVNSYTFKNLFTGNTETIHATPNHLFYVKNRRRFVALNEITSTDELLNLSGHQMRLLCPEGKKKHCGMVWKKFNISAVYNLEVYKEHQYFAGNNEIYVHNIYICLTCRQEFSKQSCLQNHITSNGHAASIYITPLNNDQALLIQQDNELDFFTERNNVADIMKTHPYRCNTCPSAFFNNESYLLKHLRIKHHFNPSGYMLSIPTTPSYFPCTTFPAIREQQLHLPIWEWEIAETRVRAIAEAELKAITELIEKAYFSERAGILEGYLPEIQSIPEDVLLGICGRSLPEIPVQTVERLAP